MRTDSRDSHAGLGSPARAIAKPIGEADYVDHVAPVPPGTRWQVLLSGETSTLYLVTVDHDDLTYEDDPRLAGLAEAVRARALELVRRGDARVIGVDRTPVEVTSWEQECSGLAREALQHYVQRVTDSAGIQDSAAEPAPAVPRTGHGGGSRMEVVVYRYPDYSHSEGVEVRVFLDGQPAEAHVTVVDPGRGHNRVDWELDCDRDALRATPAAAQVIRRFYADAARTHHIYDADQGTTR